jgi:hypothetical protein
MIRRFRWPLALGLVLALNASLWIAQFGLALPRPLSNYLFGPKMIRAEVIVKNAGVVHDYRFDRGRIRAVSGSSITLLERDGQVFTIPVSGSTRVRLNGRVASLAELRRGMNAEVLRDGDAPAERVFATSRR